MKYTGNKGLLKSIDDEVEIVEEHFHNNEKWFGAATVPAGETHVADRMDGAVVPFQLTAGNNDFNAVWTQILGSADTPVVAGKTLFDKHRILVTTTNSTNAFVIQFVCCEAADIAAKLIAEDFTEVPYISATNNADAGIADMLDDLHSTGEKIWARCACVGANGTVLNFYLGIHEY